MAGVRCTECGALGAVWTGTNAEGRDIYRCAQVRSHVFTVQKGVGATAPAPDPVAHARRGDATETPVAMSKIDSLRMRARLKVEICDCCGGKTKLYRRKLNSDMAATLCRIATHGEEWTHIGDVQTKQSYNNEVALLLHWGFVEQKLNVDTSKRTSGIWRLTPEGMAFARMETRAPSHAFVLSPNNQFQGLEETTTNIVEALGKHFDYSELMRGEGR